MSEGDVEKASRLKRSYVSRIEGGYTVPSVETLEKFARAMDGPMDQLSQDGEKLPEARPTARPKKEKLSQPVQRQLDKWTRLFPHLNDGEWMILVGLAVKRAGQKKRKSVQDQ